MYIYKKLITDDACQGKENRIIRKIRMNAGMLDTYLICLAHNSDLFDLIDCKNLKQKGYPKNDLMILGFAQGRESAIDLSAKLFLSLSDEYGQDRFKQALLAKKDTLFRRYGCI